MELQRKKKKKNKKPKKGEKSPLSKPGIVERLVKRFFKHGSKKKTLPADKLFDFFQSQFLTVSSELGLLGSLDSFTIAGDATPNEFLQRSTLPAIDRILLDAAHDAMAIYELLKHLNIEPFTYLTLAPSVILALIAISKFHLKEFLFVLPIWR